LPPLLARGGLFVGETGAGQADAVAALIAGAGLKLAASLPDLAGIPRCVVARRAD
jgi:release factor glutamine methyltransferase